MKPGSIRKFDWLYLGSIAVSLLGFVFNYDTIADQTNAELAAQGIEGLSTGVLIGGLLFGTAISLALWFMISILRIELAKWLLLLLTAWSVLTTATAAASVFDSSVAWGLISTIMTIVALWFLFQPDAKAWFAEKKGGDGQP